MHNTKLILLILFLFFNSYTKAQTSISSSGGEVVGSSGNISFTVGQISYKTVENENMSILQGVQQAFEVYLINSIQSDNEIDLYIYPNPVSSKLTIIVNRPSKYLRYTLYDLLGKEIETGGILQDKTILNLISLEGNIYFIKIYNNKQMLRIFKILKK